MLDMGDKAPAAPQHSDLEAALALGGGHGDRPLTSRRLEGVISTV